MTTDSMHIQVNLGVQSLDSNRFDDFEPEEIDVALNNAQTTFVKNVHEHLSPNKPLGFEMSERRIQELTPLIKYTKPVQTSVFLDGFDDENNTVYVDIPQDCMYLIGVRFQVTHNNCETIQKLRTRHNYFRYVSFTIDELVAGVSNYDGFKITHTAASGATEQLTTQTFPTGISEKDLLYAWLFASTNSEKNENIKQPIYYERYKDIYKPNKIILVLPDAVSGSTTEQVTITIGGVVRTFSLEDNLPETYSITTTATQKLNDIDGKFYQHNNIERALKHSYKKPSLKWRRIPYVIKDNKVLIYDSDEFTVNKAILKYVRYPNIISLPLGFNCELNPQVHDEIVQLAIYELMGITGNPRLPYQQQAVNRTGG